MKKEPYLKSKIIAASSEDCKLALLFLALIATGELKYKIHEALELALSLKENDGKVIGSIHIKKGDKFPSIPGYKDKDISFKFKEDNK